MKIKAIHEIASLIQNNSGMFENLPSHLSARQSTF